jgi:hypothetical protein
VVVENSEGVDTEPPLTDLKPVQPPDAAHDVAFRAPQVRIDAAPCVTVVGFAVKVTTGVADRTVTVADCEALPPAPEQVSTKVVVPLSAGVAADPPVGALYPLHPPEAEQEFALLDDHESVDFPPGSTVLGLARSVTIGGTTATVTVVDCVTNPPGPRQVRS